MVGASDVPSPRRSSFSVPFHSGTPVKGPPSDDVGRDGRCEHDEGPDAAGPGLRGDAGLGLVVKHPAEYTFARTTLTPLRTRGYGDAQDMLFAPTVMNPRYARSGPRRASPRP